MGDCVLERREKRICNTKKRITTTTSNERSGGWIPDKGEGTLPFHIFSVLEPQLKKAKVRAQTMGNILFLRI